MSGAYFPKRRAWLPGALRTAAGPAAVGVVLAAGLQIGGAGLGSPAATDALALRGLIPGIATLWLVAAACGVWAAGRFGGSARWAAVVTVLAAPVVLLSWLPAAQPAGYRLVAATGVTLLAALGAVSGALLPRLPDGSRSAAEKAWPGGASTAPARGVRTGGAVVGCAAAVTGLGLVAHEVVYRVLPFGSVLDGDLDVRAAALARLTLRAELADGAAQGVIALLVVALVARRAIPYGTPGPSRLARTGLVAAAPLLAWAVGLAIGLVPGGAETLSAQPGLTWLGLAAGGAAGAVIAAIRPRRAPATYGV